MLIVPASPACRSLLLLLPRAPIPLLVLADLQLPWIYRGRPWLSLILFADLVIIAPLAAVTE